MMACCLATGLAPIVAQTRGNHAEAVDKRMAKRITVLYGNADIKVVLKDLFKKAGVRYRLEFVKSAAITVHAEQTPALMVLQSIMRCTQSDVQLAYRLDHGVYVVIPAGKK